MESSQHKLGPGLETWKSNGASAPFGMRFFIAFRLWWVASGRFGGPVPVCTGFQTVATYRHDLGKSGVRFILLNQTEGIPCLIQSTRNLRTNPKKSNQSSSICAGCARRSMTNPTRCTVFSAQAGPGPRCARFPANWSRRPAFCLALVVHHERSH